MGSAEGVVFALSAFGEAGEPAALTQGADAIAAAGQDLVRIGLVADVPHQPIVRCVKYVVERHRELDHAQTGAKMATCDRHGIDRLLSQFISNLTKLAWVEAPEIGGGLDAVE